MAATSLGLLAVSPLCAQYFGPDHKPHPPHFVHWLTYKPEISHVTAWYGAINTRTGVILCGVFDAPGAPAGETRIVRLSHEGVLDSSFQPPRTVMRDEVIEPIIPIHPQNTAMSSGQVLVRAGDEFWRLNVDGSRDTGFPTITGVLLADHPSRSFVVADSGGRLTRFTRDGAKIDMFHAEPIANIERLFIASDQRLLVAVRTAAGLRFLRLQIDGSLDRDYSVTFPLHGQAYEIVTAGEDLIVCTEEPTLQDGLSTVRFTRFDSSGRKTLVTDVRPDLLEVGGLILDLKEYSVYSHGWDFSRFELGARFLAFFGILAIPGVADARAAHFKPVAMFNPYPSATLPRGTFAPQFLIEPSSQHAALGGSVALRAQAIGQQEMTYQWYKDGAPVGTARTVAGGDILTVSELQPSDESDYYVEVTNAAGRATSHAVRVTLSTPPRVVQSAPAALNLAPGQSLALTLGLSGGDLRVQWLRDGEVVYESGDVGQSSGSQHTALLPPGRAHPGVYRAIVSNSRGTTMSREVEVSRGSSVEPAQLQNVSVLAQSGVNEESLIVGFVLSGVVHTTLPVLVRGIGPALESFGVPHVLPDPHLVVRSGSATMAANNDWSGDIDVANAGAQAGAFTIADIHSRDAGVFIPHLPPGGYTVQVLDGTGQTGTALVEVYSTRFSRGASDPRIQNISSRANVGGASAPLIAGFVVAGPNAKTLLVRGIGPVLKQFGVRNPTVATPLIIRNNAGAVVASGHAYPEDRVYAETAAKVGAFAVKSDYDKNAALLVTLPPGAYTAEVKSRVPGVSGTAMVEIYAVE